MTVGVLLLAAGSSRRFGSDKRQALLADGESLLQAAIAPVIRAGLPLRVCLAPGDTAWQALLLAQGIDCLRCRNAARGMGATLADGVRQLPAWHGVLIALADMPGISADTFRAVAGQLGPGAIHVPVYQGRRGHPVGFGRDLFPALAALDGDVGARRLISAQAGRVRQIEVADAGILDDVDTPGQLPAAGSVP